MNDKSNPEREKVLTEAIEMVRKINDWSCAKEGSEFDRGYKIACGLVMKNLGIMKEER